MSGFRVIGLLLTLSAFADRDVGRGESVFNLNP
jgi:hypothetical protein